MSRKKGFVVLVAVVSGLVLIGAAAVVELVDINRDPTASPPQLQSTVVTQGQWAVFEVHHDNFLWMLDGREVSGEHILFTEQMLEACGITAYMENEAVGYFSQPTLWVREGKLYIAVQTLQVGQEIPLSVGVQIHRFKAVASRSKITIQASSNPDPKPDPNPDPDPEPEPNEGSNGGSGGGSGSGGEAMLQIYSLDPDVLRQELVDNALGEWVEAKAGDTLWIPLPKTAFLWADGDGVVSAPGADDTLTLAKLQNAGIEVYLQQGGRVCLSAKLTQRTSGVGIELQMAERVVALQNVPFAVEIQVQDRHQSVQLQITGVLETAVLGLDGSQSSVSVEAGQVLAPLVTINNAQVYLGCGVTVQATLQPGKRYTGTAVRQKHSAGEAEVCSIFLLGFDASAKVRIDDNYAGYIYGKEGNYLGRSGTFLPVYDVYYIYSGMKTGGTGTSRQTSGGGVYVGAGNAAALGDFFSEEISVEPDKQPDYTTNANDNPSTGKLNFFCMQQFAVNPPLITCRSQK